MEKIKFGDRMKYYEKVETEDYFIPTLPVIIRLDGINFSSYCKNFYKPFDFNFSNTMVETTEFLMKEFNAILGYTQSDEISLLLYSDRFDKPIYCNGKKHKIISHSASKCATYFNDIFKNNEKIANFDSRAFNLPTLDEALNEFIWRQDDAKKNSISGLAQVYFSHNQLMNQNSLDKIKMLKDIGVFWHDRQDFIKYGTFIRKTKVKRSFTYVERNILPEKHEARRDPSLQYERTAYHHFSDELRHIENNINYVFGNLINI